MTDRIRQPQPQQRLPSVEAKQALIDFPLVDSATHRALLIEFYERCRSRLTSAPALFSNDATFLFDEFLFFLGATAVRQLWVSDAGDAAEVAASIPKDGVGDMIEQHIALLSLRELRDKAIGDDEWKIAALKGEAPIMERPPTPCNGFLDSVLVIPLPWNATARLGLLEIYFARTFLSDEGSNEFAGASLLLHVPAGLTYALSLLANEWPGTFYGRHSLRADRAALPPSLPTAAEQTRFGSIHAAKQEFLARVKSYHPIQFVSAYKAFFEPLDVFFTKLSRQVFDSLDESRAEDIAIRFVYRGKSGQAISFFLTSDQLESLFRCAHEAHGDSAIHDDIEGLLLFQYQPSQLLVGSVLSSQCSVDVRDYQADPRQKCSPGQPDTDLQRQITRVQTLFESSGNQPHTFMVPITTPLNDNTIGSPIVAVVVLTLARPLRSLEKLRILDTVWRLAPAVEATMQAQQAVEYRVRTESNTLTQMGHYAGVMAHQIRPALAACASLIKQMPTGGSENARRKRKFDNLQSEVEAGVDSINRFLAMARTGALDSSRYRSTDVVLEVRGLIAELQDRENWQIDGRPVKVEFTEEMNGNAAVAKLEREYFFTAFRNVLHNAHDAIRTRFQGNRTTATDSSFPLIKIRFSHEGDFLLIDVEDNGSGIPIPERESIFQEFFSTKKFRKDVFGGLGLGLPSARKIIEDLGGRLTLLNTDNKLDRPSVFRFQIPLESNNTKSESKFFCR